MFSGLSLYQVAQAVESPWLTSSRALSIRLCEIRLDLFAQFPAQLNLEKIHSPHKDSEWADLICLLFSKIPDAFIVVETEDLRKAYRHDSDWANRLLHLLQRVVDQTNSAGNRLKILLVLYGNVLKIPTATSKDSKLIVT
ncbi:hypothetical protein T440DRAFT_470386 [Plenodomus tracheiphilus IPT5]|uniref:Uncharacterized protein n=1 Tax=Plenodomus tracheiphilus IPT5 TaxID=1408161 RepID=A0A6A7AZN0_9PLEO|nr:hypothetical protein T440DRAFT_470386 [Plenodomus tracheiphilus IPT5]